MCGFIFTNFKNVTTRKLNESLDLLNHRGPDYKKSLRINDFFFGHTRLKIIDLSDKSNQPFYSRDKQLIILFNGEIYNYKELSKKYNIELRFNSDTELLIELFNIKGISIVNELNGMFSFVIYEIKTNKYYIVRDRLGVKPLYEYRYNKQFIISSEISPILNLISNAKIDNIAVRQIKKFRNYFDNRTIYEDIKSFPPGSYFYNNYYYKYWSLEPNINKFNYEEFSELLKSSINLRMISDVNVGSFLSGGLDSSIIASLVNVKNTWSIGFKSNNEFKYIDILSKNIKKNNFQKTYNEKNFLIDAKKIIKIKKEPILVPNEVLLYSLSKNIRKKNTVVLSGEGADELFFGYDRIFNWALKNKWKLSEFVSLYCYGANSDPEIENDVMSKFQIYKKNWLNISYFFQTSHLNGLLKRLDSATMLNSIEARSPFVDYRLVEYMFGIDPKYKIANNNSKIILKKFSSGYLPDSIINRKKIGFPVFLKDIHFSKDVLGYDHFEKWINYNLNLIK